MTDDDWQPTDANRAPNLPDPDDHRLRASAVPVLSGIPPVTKEVVMELSWVDATKRYRIRTISNTSYYKPDQWLTEEGVAIIAMKYPNWKFSASSPDYIAMLLGLMGRVALR
jgi:hypothetical protein